MGVTECRVINRSVSVGAPLFFGRIVMPNDKKSLEEARRCAFSWMIQLRAIGAPEILNHELFQYIAIFDDPGFEKTFLKHFGPPSGQVVADSEEAMVYAYKQYAHAFEMVHATLLNTGARTEEIGKLLPKSPKSILYQGQSPRYTQ